MPSSENGLNVRASEWLPQGGLSKQFGRQASSSEGLDGGPSRQETAADGRAGLTGSGRGVSSASAASPRAGGRDMDTNLDNELMHRNDEDNINEEEDQEEELLFDFHINETQRARSAGSTGRP